MLIGVTIIFSLYLMIILISFNPSDPGWLQIIWHGSINNVGGIIGARFSDFLFFIFGISAYIIPVFILLFFWRIYKRKVSTSFFVILFEYIQLLVLLCVFCGLMNLLFDDVFYFASGGLIGCILCDWISSYINTVHYISLILFLIGTINIVMIFNEFFLIVLKVVITQLLNIISVLKKIFCKNQKIRFQRIHYKLNNQIRVYPTICLIKNNFDYSQRDIISKSLQIKKLPSIYINISSFFKKFNMNLKNDADIKTYIDLTNVLKCVSKRAANADLCLNKINYYSYKKKSVDTIYLPQKNFFKQFNKYYVKLHKDNQLFSLQKKKYKSNNLLQKSSGLVCIANNHVIQKSALVSENLNRHTSPATKTDFLAENQDLCNNMKRNIFPDINLLMTSLVKDAVDPVELKNISQLLEKKLLEYRILANVINVIPGPIITRFELNLSAGIKSSRIVGLSRDLARSLSVTSVRVVEIVPGTPYIGLEVPNKRRTMIYLHDVINSDQFRKIKTPLALVLGQDISGNPVIADLRRMPHLLIAGTTGSGKSVGINAMIIGILYKAKPDEVRFIMIDPKILELSIYSKIPHILKQVITETQDADLMLQWCIKEMERRYKLMAILGVRNLENYNYNVEQLYSKEYAVGSCTKKFVDNKTVLINEKLKKLPYIVVIVDELSDLMITTTKKIEALIVRLTQKARAAGIHLILATQRPSVNVITGLIKANIPARIAFTVSSKIDSHTILGQSGAESLLGMGDMLYLAPNSSSIPIRVHGAYVQDQEIYAVVDFWSTQIKNK